MLFKQEILRHQLLRTSFDKLIPALNYKFHIQEGY